ncbi:MAG: hypothetical protein GYB66_09800, partial [Chloroflexi bacterium]|nr:hypothetical protein [Chloroflexota bacterium]
MRRSALIAILAAYLGLAGAFAVMETVFERLPHLEDEIAFIYQARIFAGGRVYIQSPKPARVFWQPFVIDCTDADDEEFGINCDGKRFGKYPPGWPLLLAIGFLAELEWVLNPLFFSLTIALTYRLGREVFDERVGVVAAILLAASPIALLHSGSWMSHPSALFFT